MSTNKMGRSPGKDATPKTTYTKHNTASDPLIGWFNLAKPVRNRPQKSTVCTWRKVGGR